MTSFKELQQRCEKNTQRLNAIDANMQRMMTHMEETLKLLIEMQTRMEKKK